MIMTWKERVCPSALPVWQSSFSPLDGSDAVLQTSGIERLIDMDFNNLIHSLEKDLIDMWSNQGFVCI